MLEDEVAVEKDGLDLREERVVAVEVRPASLHHADLRVSKVVNNAHEPVFGRDEVSVKDGDELALTLFHAFFQGAGFETLAVVAMNVFDGMSESLIAFYNRAGHVHSLVS